MSLGNEFGNPVLTPDRLRSEHGEGAMSVAGTVVKLGFLLVVLLVGAGITWKMAFKAWSGFDFSTLTSVTEKGEDGKDVTRYKVVEQGREGPVYKDPPQFDLSPVTRLMWLGLAGGLVTGLIVAFVPRLAMALSVPYAFCEGLAIGGISACFEVQFGGIVIQAAGLTFAVLIAMAFLYLTGVLRASSGFVLGLLGLMLGVVVFYIADAVLIGFGGKGFSLIHSNSGWGIGFSVFVCILAAFNFVVDFATIEDGVRSRAPKHMEWFAAWGVLVTLIWLYLEILRLLAKLKGKNGGSSRSFLLM